jgi:hypothetical protein
MPFMELSISDTVDNPVPGGSWLLTLATTAEDLALDAVALEAAADATAWLATAGDG